MTGKSSIVCAACVLAVSSFAGMDIAPVDASADRNPSPLQVELRRIGTLRPRGVPDGVETARWWQLRGKPVTLPVERLGGGEAIVVVPALSAWNCGWLAI